MNLVLVFLFPFLILSFALFFLVFVFFKVILPLIFWGAMYVPAKEDKIKKMIEFAEVKPGEKAVDLGSGDGRLVIALARAGAEAHGYEINPFLVFLSRRKVKKAGFNNKAFIHQKSFWREDLSKFNVITIYGIDFIMNRLEKKLKREIKKDAKVISNTFNFPNWSQTKKENNIYLYRK